MQTQDAPAEFLIKLWPWLEAKKNLLIGIAIALLVIWGIYFFVTTQQEQKELAAGQALTQLLTTPPASAAGAGQMADALARLAAQYPGTAAGQRAQLQAAAALFTTGRYAEAQAQFQKFIDANASGPLAATAQLGIATSLEAQGKPEALAAYQRVVSVFPASPAEPAAKAALARLQRPAKP